MRCYTVSLKQIGGKPRKHGKYKDKEPAKRGRGTKKTPVIGAVERGGKVVAEVAKGLTETERFFSLINRETPGDTQRGIPDSPASA